MAKTVPDKKKAPKKAEIDFFADLLKGSGVEMPLVSKVDPMKGVMFFSSGSLLLNGLLSASMKGGFANKVTALAGEYATGKTFIALEAVKNFLAAYPTGQVLIFDSEDDPSKSRASLQNRGIDISRVRVKMVNTIQDVRYDLVRIVAYYLTFPKDKRPPFLVVLDSLGNLSTSKEMKDVLANAVNKKGDDVKDMTRAAVIKAMFRVLTTQLGHANVAMIITNHVYDTMDPYGAKKAMSGGSGISYNASTIVFFAKAKLKDEKDEKIIVGSKLTATLEKSRFSPYGKKAPLLLRHDTGLDKYWGLFDFGKERGLLIKGTGEKGNKIAVNDYKFPDGQIGSKKEIEATPAKYFESQVNFDAFEAEVAVAFSYGDTHQIVDDETFEIDEVEEMNAEINAMLADPDDSGFPVVGSD